MGICALGRAAFAMAALAGAGPAAAGDPVPGIEIALEEAATPDGQRIVSVSIDRGRLKAGPNMTSAMNHNLAETLAQVGLRASRGETAFVAQRIAELAGVRNGATIPRNTRYCFRAWCANIDLRRQPNAELTPIRR